MAKSHACETGWGGEGAWLAGVERGRDWLGWRGGVTGWGGEGAWLAGVSVSIPRVWIPADSWPFLWVNFLTLWHPYQNLLVFDVANGKIHIASEPLMNVQWVSYWSSDMWTNCFHMRLQTTWNICPSYVMT